MKYSTVFPELYEFLLRYLDLIAQHRAFGTGHKIQQKNRRLRPPAVHHLFGSSTFGSSALPSWTGGDRWLVPFTSARVSSRWGPSRFYRQSACQDSPSPTRASVRVAAQEPQ